MGSTSVGTTLGVYEVLAAIGAGGMGEVYKARDTKLDRDVALKILPDAFVNDPERLARFQREAKVLASLNHPNIAQIHGLEESGDSPALVLEYVPGPTLQDRIAKGPIPLDEALPIARQIAEALEAAHEQGIIHRDLKPANVKVRDDGTVKVLDFGLAKALGPDLSDAEAANSPTMTMTAAATKMGVIMGTAAYMSPEQARGKTVDKRADIWAFGVVLFEMLTGRQAFAGTDISLTLAAVLRQDMDWAELPSDTPHSIRRLLRRCLERDHRRRLPEIGTARLEIDEADAAPEISAAVATTPIVQPALWQRPVSIAAALVLALAVGGLAVWSIVQPDSVLVVRVPIPLGADETFSSTGRHSVAISPDGRRIVYVANGGLWLRPIDQLQATAMAATFGDTNARNPFFSPDGQWVGYHSGQGLKKVSISGGAPVVLSDADNPHGASWGADDAILFGQGLEGIWQVPGAGGSPDQLIALDDGALAHGPQMLPGGEWVLFTLRPANTLLWDEAQIVVQSVATGERRVLIAGGRDGRYVATGHLVYALNGGLFAVPFDLGARDVTGGPVSLIEGILDGDVRTGAAHFSLSSAGSLVYIPGSAGTTDDIDLVWVDRTGDVEPVGVETRAFGRVRVSPDGTRLAVDTLGGSTSPDLWIYDLSRDTLTRLTFDEGLDQRPLWTPDGSRVVFQSSREEGGLFWKAADGTGDVERLLESSEFTVPESWSADGRLLFTQNPGDIGVLTVEGERTMELLLDTEFVEASPAISPDGRWIAYESNESGQVEVYVRPFPDVDTGKWQVSSAGGFDPVWSPDGRELFFAAFEGSVGDTFTVAQVETEPTFSATTPERLFDLGPFDLTTRGRGWDIAPDGDRFIFRTRRAAQTSGAAPFNGLIFVQNWTQELLERVPVP